MWEYEVMIIATGEREFLYGYTTVTDALQEAGLGVNDVILLGVDYID